MRTFCGFEIAVDDGAPRLTVDDRRKVVGGFEKGAQLEGDADGARDWNGAARDDVGEVLAVEILHRDEEVARFVRQVLVDGRERAC